MDRVILGKQTYELPKKTLEIVDKIDALMQIESKYERGAITARECVTAEYDFLLELMGAEITEATLGTDNISEVDVSDVSIAVSNILTAYSKRLETEKIKNAVSVLNTPDVKRVLDIAEKASALKND